VWLYKGKRWDKYVGAAGTGVVVIEKQNSIYCYACKTYSSADIMLSTIGERKQAKSRRKTYRKTTNLRNRSHHSQALARHLSTCKNKPGLAALKEKFKLKKEALN